MCKRVCVLISKWAQVELAYSLESVCTRLLSFCADHFHLPAKRLLFFVPLLIEKTVHLHARQSPMCHRTTHQTFAAFHHCAAVTRADIT